MLLELIRCFIFDLGALRRGPLDHSVDLRSVLHDLRGVLLDGVVLDFRRSRR